ncbi:hypothetical protein MLD38_037387 [Melastoma candidum]|uniref:Uncharacterized protein n=1 Tax=Melastoma candidum TaxID=119954 RepID=A0ACB9LNS5_9MYRT|nr:hypothetical protein MLD38_037387 [Melastoma candidum]
MPFREHELRELAALLAINYRTPATPSSSRPAANTGVVNWYENKPKDCNKTKAAKVSEGLAKQSKSSFFVFPSGSCLIFHGERVRGMEMRSRDCYFGQRIERLRETAGGFYNSWTYTSDEIRQVEEIVRPGCSPEVLKIALASVTDLVDRLSSIPSQNRCSL